MISQSFLLCASLSTDRQAVTSFCSTQHMGDSAFLWFENAETQGKVSVACAPRRWTGFMPALRVPCCKGSHSSWLLMRPEMEHHLGVARMDPLEACVCMGRPPLAPSELWTVASDLTQEHRDKLCEHRNPHPPLEEKKEKASAPWSDTRCLGRIGFDNVHRAAEESLGLPVPLLVIKSLCVFISCGSAHGKSLTGSRRMLETGRTQGSFTQRCFLKSM